MAFLPQLLTLPPSLFYNRIWPPDPIRWLFWDTSLPSSQFASFQNKVVFLASASCLLDYWPVVWWPQGACTLQHTYLTNHGKEILPPCFKRFHLFSQTLVIFSTAGILIFLIISWKTYWELPVYFFTSNLLGTKTASYYSLKSNLMSSCTE